MNLWCIDILIECIDIPLIQESFQAGIDDLVVSFVPGRRRESPHKNPWIKMNPSDGPTFVSFCFPFVLLVCLLVCFFVSLFLCLLICLFPFNNKKKKNEWKKKNKKKVFKKKTRGRKKGKKRFVFVSEMDWLIFADLVRGSWDDCIPHDWDRLRKEKKRKSHR